jgi:predicted nucleic acid-binding protein
LAFVRSWLVDTGPLVAYFLASDPSHASVAARLDGFSGELFTTSPVITEVMHFVGQDPTGPRVLAEFALAAGLTIFDFTQPGLLREAASLMETYSDTPMDFADATLVLLAEKLDVLNVLTLDRRGFHTYRTRDGKPFRLVLDLDPF